MLLVPLRGKIPGPDALAVRPVEQGLQLVGGARAFLIALEDRALRVAGAGFNAAALHLHHGGAKMNAGLAVDALRGPASTVNAFIDARKLQRMIDLAGPLGAPLLKLILLIPLPALFAEVVAFDQTNQALELSAEAIDLNPPSKPVQSAEIVACDERGGPARALTLDERFSSFR